MYEINFKETRKIIMENTSKDNEYQDKKRKKREIWHAVQNTSTLFE